MPNPYHDAEGRFCSKEEMAAAIRKAETDGDFETYFQLRTAYNNAVDSQAAMPESLQDGSNMVRLFGSSEQVENLLDDPYMTLHQIQEMACNRYLSKQTVGRLLSETLARFGARDTARTWDTVMAARGRTDLFYTEVQGVHPLKDAPTEWLEDTRNGVPTRWLQAQVDSCETQYNQLMDDPNRDIQRVLDAQVVMKLKALETINL